jgi:hypothetical protein
MRKAEFGSGKAEFGSENAEDGIRKWEAESIARRAEREELTGVSPAAGQKNGQSNRKRNSSMTNVD